MATLKALELAKVGKNVLIVAPKLKDLLYAKFFRGQPGIKVELLSRYKHDQLLEERREGKLNEPGLTEAERPQAIIPYPSSRTPQNS